MKPWFSCGFTKPACKERDLVKFEADRTDNGYYNVLPRTFRNLEKS